MDVLKCKDCSKEISLYLGNDDWYVYCDCMKVECNSLLPTNWSPENNGMCLSCEKRPVLKGSKLKGFYLECLCESISYQGRINYKWSYNY